MDMSPARDSPFLAVPVSDRVVDHDLVFAIRDGFPVSPGHILVVTSRIVATWWDANPRERVALMDAVDEVRRLLLDDDSRQALWPGLRRPDGFNVGFNAGAAAGQTVGHLHVHVIPRYLGDVDDPRGGVRHVIPALGNYLA